jgi:hypothetical protein
VTPSPSNQVTPVASNQPSRAATPLENSFEDNDSFELLNQAQQQDPTVLYQAIGQHAKFVAQQRLQQDAIEHKKVKAALNVHQ